MMKMSEKTWNKKRKLKERKMRQALKWAVDKQPFTKRALLAGPWKGLKPAAAVRYLKEMRDRNWILMQGSTRKATYILLDETQESQMAEIKDMSGADPVEETPEEEPMNAWVVARGQTGQRAVNIATLVDALLAGEAGLNALGEIKNQAVLILGDLELLEE